MTRSLLLLLLGGKGNLGWGAAEQSGVGSGVAATPRVLQTRNQSQARVLGECWTVPGEPDAPGLAGPTPFSYMPVLGLERTRAPGRLPLVSEGVIPSLPRAFGDPGPLTGSPGGSSLIGSVSMLSGLLLAERRAARALRG